MFRGCYGSIIYFYVECVVGWLGKRLERRNIRTCWHSWITLLYIIIFSVMVNGTILVLLMSVVL